MNLKDFIASGLLTEFSRTISRQNAEIILRGIGFSSEARPGFPRQDNGRLNFWMSIGEQIEAGVLPEGRDLLVLAEAAANVYQSNLVFGPYRRQVAAPPANQPSGPTNGVTSAPTPTAPTSAGQQFVHLLIDGWEANIAGLCELASRLASKTFGRPAESVTPRYHSAVGEIVLQLRDWTFEDADRLGQEIRAASPPELGARSSVFVTGFEDYLLPRLRVEGPDQQRFELTDVPASTLVRDVAENVMSEYHEPNAQGEVKGIGRREVVVDRIGPEGTSERLEPDKTLHEQRVRPDDTLSVSPESTAGAVNPLIREAALSRAKAEVLDFAASHRGFAVQANSKIAPTEYVFAFRAPSFGPPSRPGADPVEVDEHRVFLYLPPDFPMGAPQAYWQTPIFHPNIHPENGAVCLGAIAKRYQPGLSFGRLCQLLIDVASYRNYAAEEGYNLAAQEWAFSPQAQEVIERRGGKSILRMLLHDSHEPRRLLVKRVAE